MTTTSRYPNMLAGGITDEGSVQPFELFAGESDIVTSQAQAGNTAIEQFRVVAMGSDGRLTPWQGNEAVAAAGTVTFSTAVPSANDTVTINGTAITFVASGATGNQINIPGTLALTGAALVSFLAANEATFKVRAASSGAGPTVVTLTALEPGTDGNSLALAKSGTNIAVNAAALAGGTAGNRPCGIAAQPILANSWGPYFSGGVFNHAALVWPTAISTLALRRAAFAGTNINVQAILGSAGSIVYP